MAPDQGEFERLLEPLLRVLDLALDPEQIGKLWAHYQVLNRWKARVNLTSIHEMEDIVRRHFGESLAVARVIGEGNGAVVDVGSGAGFPGVPVAVCFPGRDVTLVESVGKKATFLKEATRGIGNVAVFGGRFEDVEGRFEWGCLRAVATGALRGHLKRAVSKVAMIGSAASAEGTSEELGLSRVETYILPWDTRTGVVTGRYG